MGLRNYAGNGAPKGLKLLEKRSEVRPRSASFLGEEKRRSGVA